MKRRRKKTNTTSALNILENEESEFSQLREKWILRILLKTIAHRDFLNCGDYRDDHYKSSLPVLKEIDTDTTENEILNILKSRASEIESANSPRDFKSTLTENIDMLGRTLNLSTIEKELISFIVIARSDKSLSAAMDRIGDLNKSNLIVTLSKVLDLPRNEISKALAKDSVLIASGLVKIDNSTQRFSYKLELLDQFEDHILQPNISVEQLMENYFTLCGSTDLEESDFPHLNKDLEILIPFITSAHQNKTQGVNLAIYGDPGVGKTETVRLLAKMMRMPLYEVRFDNSEGEALSVQSRLSALKLCQTFLKHIGKGFVLVDEVENLLEKNYFMFDTDSRAKGYINKILEENPVVSFWLCNDVEFDKAYMRRFSYSLHLRTPPFNIRRKMLLNALHQNSVAVSDEWVDATAKSEKLTPALISQVAEVAGCLGTNNGTTSEKILNQLINAKFEFMGISERVGKKKMSDIPYRLEYVNSDVDMESFINGIKEQNQASVLLRGSSGCGKTNFVEYVSEQIEKPLLKKRASDLLNKFVGESEKEIRRAFDEAEASGSILLLDEVDSFLRKRASAQHSWEVTQVNELLVAMAEFEGILFCCTNSEIEDLDDASIRRFDLKIEFKNLKPHQKWQLFQEVCEVQAEDQLILKQKVFNLYGLTVGDFSTVVRQAKIMGNKDAWAIYQSLSRECELKAGKTCKVIGF
jgi:transitional endoplasmic reticulum ATPase